MYTQEPKEHQFSFSHDWFVVPQLDPNHPLVKIANMINWVSLSDKLAKFYSSNNGRPSKSIRAKLGLLILKHLYKLSDVNVVNMLRENIYAEYLCDVSLKEAKTFINPSSLTKFRKQICIEGVKIIEQEVLNVLKKAKLLKGKRLVTDTTIVPSNIAYPTDISLLENLRRKTIKYLDTLKEFNSKTYRTYKRVARKVFNQYQKIRHHTVKSRRICNRKLIQFTKRNIAQLKDSLHHIPDTIVSWGNKSKDTLIREVTQFLDIASTILKQQKDIYNNLPVQERIVSIHKPHIRPMVRGKYPNKVEFGPKILLNLKNDILLLEDLRFQNISDTHLLEPAIQGYLSRFGHSPTQLSTDRGFWSKDNYKLAQDYNISKIAIQNKGKSNYLKDKPFAKRLFRLRSKIEAKISLAKRKFGLDKALYNIPYGEEIWIRLGLISMNLKTACFYDYG